MQLLDFSECSPSVDFTCHYPRLVDIEVGVFLSVLTIKKILNTTDLCILYLANGDTKRDTIFEEAIPSMNML